MNRRMLLLFCIIALVIITSAFFGLLNKAVLRGDVIDSTGQSQPRHDKITSTSTSTSAPRPPAGPSGGEPIVKFPPEPPRTLVGVTEEGLSRVKQLMASGEEIARYPIDNSHEKAALSHTDLDGDGKPEVIFVHTTGEAATTNNIPLLRLDLVTSNGENATKRVSVQLLGTYVYNNIYDHAGSPFAVRDITGDGRPEIVVTSAIGASLGATMQAFSFNGEKLSEIARIEGHHFEVINRGVGRAAVIRSRWKDEETVQTFVWNGKEFQAAK